MKNKQDNMWSRHYIANGFGLFYSNFSFKLSKFLISFTFTINSSLTSDTDFEFQVDYKVNF